MVCFSSYEEISPLHFKYFTVISETSQKRDFIALMKSDSKTAFQRLNKPVVMIDYQVVYHISAVLLTTFL